MARWIASVAAFVVILALAPASPAREKHHELRLTRVLFIGNSYTYFNNLPEMLTRLAETSGQARVETRMVAPGGWRLKDHWNKGEALKVLREGNWNYVVMQDQSTLGVNYYVEGKPHVAGDEIFRPFARQLAAEIRKAGSIPVFYLTWARKATPEDQAALNYAYVSAAKEIRAVLAPVGIAWAQIAQKRPDIDLYQKDGSHPSPAGSYLAACTLYAALFGRSPVGLPATATGSRVNLLTGKPDPEKTQVLVDLPAEHARALQSAAWTAWQELKKNGGYPAVSPVRAPSVDPLPAGEALSPATLEGTWRGTVLFYPVAPVEMILQLRFESTAPKGHLELKYHSKDFKDESFDLNELNVGDRELTFSDPASVGVDNFKVHFRGVIARAGEMRGIAETVKDSPDWPLRMLGTWQLRKAAR